MRVPVWNHGLQALCGGWLAVAALLAVGLANAAEPSVIIDLSTDPTPQDDAPAIVRPDGRAVIRLLVKPPEKYAAIARLRLSAFASQDGTDQVAVGFHGSRDQFGIPRTVWDQGLTVQNDALDVVLVTAKLEPGETYSGTLTVSLDDREIVSQIFILRPQEIPAFKGPESALVVSPDGKIRVPITSNIPDEKPSKAETWPPLADMKLSAFRSGENERATVVFGDGETGSQPQDSEARRPVAGDFAVNLVASDLKQGASYSGRLELTLDGADGAARTEVIELTLIYPMQPKSTLVAGTQVISQVIRLPFCDSLQLRLCGSLFPADEPAVSSDETEIALILEDQSGQRRVEGISVGLAGTSSAPGGTFELSRHAVFRINQDDAGDLTVWPPLSDDAGAVALRTLERGEKAKVTVGFKDLIPGEYKFDLRFSADNSESSDLQKVSVTLKVKDSWVAALVVLIGSLVLSYVITKGIANWQTRTNTKRRIKRLQDTWPRADSPQPWNVWARAVLAQCMCLASKRWLFPAAPSIAEHLARVERLEQVARRHLEASDELAGSGCHTRIEHHIQAALSGAVAGLDPERLSDEDTKAILAQIADLSAWIKAPDARYWQEITSKAGRLVDTVSAVNLDHEFFAAKAHVEQILNDLDQPSAQPTPQQIEEFDNNYWKLYRFWERRGREQEIEVLKAGLASGKMGDFFDAANSCTWTGLEEQSAAGRIDILPNDDTPPPRPQEMLQPIGFALDFNDPVLNQTYLTQKTLRHEWRFCLEDRKGRTVRDWKVTSQGPKVTQFAPDRGKLSVKTVKIRWPKQTGILDLAPLTAETPLTICANTELKLSRNIVASEVVLIVLLALVALGGGLSQFYAANDTFGSFQDYMGLLVWAVGLDQGKNLIQSLNDRT